ncbi:hypothetical protein Asi03nite_44580 [Actinoplanes siamensis]|uniref:Uncharacterized protein n=1 Tax=Actinoplanes siamensis TaxID=1223317 RepID=A0A919N9X0_9ACTN|nr:hypothetical protein Asi03nite_44580 [Actinoplanes siamensis]
MDQAGHADGGPGRPSSSFTGQVTANDLAGRLRLPAADQRAAHRSLGGRRPVSLEPDGAATDGQPYTCAGLTPYVRGKRAP